MGYELELGRVEFDAYGSGCGYVSLSYSDDPKENERKDKILFGKQTHLGYEGVLSPKEVEELEVIYKEIKE